MQTLFFVISGSHAQNTTATCAITYINIIETSQHLSNMLKHNSIVLARKDIEIWLDKMLLGCYYESNNFQKVKKTPTYSLSSSSFFKCW